MATNWNAIVSNANSLADILMILRKVLAGLDGKADITLIDEALADIEKVKSDVADEIEYFKKVINESVESGLYVPFSTEAELLAYAPDVEPVVGKAFDTRKVWIWETRDPETTPSWHDMGLSELDQAKFYTDTESGKVVTLIDLKIDGGRLNYATTSSYTFSGYINASGSFVSSNAGYKTTDFIAISPNQKFKYSVNASSTVSAISFWDKNKVFISSIVSNNNPVEVEATSPANARFIRSSSNLNATPNAYIYALFTAILDDPKLIKTSSLTTEPSLNLAKAEYIVPDKYVNNVGGISSAVGWEYIKIPVVAGQTYTFGRFTIDQAGYYAFYDASSVYISGTVTSFNNASLPRTVVAPVGAAFILIDIKRPTGINDRSQLTVNAGSSLIDYVEPVDTITRISGLPLAGSGNGGGGEPLPDDVVTQGGNATLADLIADSVRAGAFFSNLPTADDPSLEIGQAYEDANGFIKVKR